MVTVLAVHEPPLTSRVRRPFEEVVPTGGVTVPLVAVEVNVQPPVGVNTPVGFSTWCSMVTDPPQLASAKVCRIEPRSA